MLRVRQVELANSSVLWSQVVLHQTLSMDDLIPFSSDLNLYLPYNILHHICRWFTLKKRKNVEFINWKFMVIRCTRVHNYLSRLDSSGHFTISKNSALIARPSSLSIYEKKAII